MDSDAKRELINSFVTENDPAKFVVKKLDVSKVPPFKIWYFIGKRASGKSHAMRYVAYMTRDKYDACIAFSPTRSTVDDFDNHLNFTYVDDQGFSEEKLIALKNKIDQLQRSNRKYKKNILVMLDDIAYDRASMKSEILNYLFLNGRHSHITLMITSQTILSLAPGLRGNIDLVFAFKNNVFNDRQKLWKNFFGVYSSFQAFDRVFTHCTKNFGALVINNYNSTGNMKDSVFYFKASQTIPPFKIGKPEIRKYGTVVANVAKKIHKIKEEQRKRDKIMRKAVIVNNPNIEKKLEKASKRKKL